TTRARVGPFVFLADNDKVDVLGLFVIKRAKSLIIEFYGTQVDVLLHFEAQAQEDSLFEDAGLYVGMPNGSEQNSRKLSEFADDAVGQGFIRTQVSLAAQIVVLRSEEHTSEL